MKKFTRMDPKNAHEKFTRITKVEPEKILNNKKKNAALHIIYQTNDTMNTGQTFDDLP